MIAAVFRRGVAGPLNGCEQIIAQQRRVCLGGSSACSRDTPQRPPDEVCRDRVRKLTRLVAQQICAINFTNPVVGTKTWLAGIGVGTR